MQENNDLSHDIGIWCLRCSMRGKVHIIFLSALMLAVIFFFPRLMTGSPSTLKPNLDLKYDLTLIGPVACESLCQFPKLWVDALSDDLKINVIPITVCRREEASLKLAKILAQGFQGPGKVAILFENVWMEGNNAYESVPKESIIKIAYSAYESTKLHSKWVEAFNNHFDAVVVMDPFFRDVYISSGVKVPIFVLPQGLNLKKYYKEPDRTIPHRPFVFGNSGAFWIRKNQELLLRAFAKEFGNSPEVCLKIHGRGGELSIINAMDQIINDYDLSNVTILSKRLSESEHLDFLRSIDAYALISRAEGYSISPREAMAAGIPCILSNNTAHKTLCASELVEAIKSEIPVTHTWAGEEVGVMFDCEEDAVRAALRSVYDNYQNSLAKAKIAREWIKRDEFDALKPLFLTLVKPKQVVMGNTNTLENGKLITNSETLYKKYLQVIER